VTMPSDPVGELRHDCRADVDADHPYTGRRHVPRADRVEHGRQHQDHVRTFDRTGVGRLCLREIHQGVGKRTVVTDRAGKHERHSTPNAFVEDPAADQPCLHRLADPARGPHAIDGHQVVAMALVDGLAAGEVDAE
jgi:hypothetical protein